MTLSLDQVGKAKTGSMKGANQGLPQIDSLAQKYEKQGNYLEAVKYHETSLVLKADLHGKNSQEFWSAALDLARQYNAHGMSVLSKGDMTTSYELLSKASIIVSGKKTKGELEDMRVKLEAITLNNLGCYFKKKGKLHSALKYLRQALELEERNKGADNPSGTHLNLCAILSELGIHQEALDHAEKALACVELAPSAEPSLLVISHHNVAAEHEHLGNYEECIVHYKLAHDIASESIGPQAPMTVAMKNSAKKAMMAQRNRLSESVGGSRSTTPRGRYTPGSYVASAAPPRGAGPTKTKKKTRSKSRTSVSKNSLQFASSVYEGSRGKTSTPTTDSKQQPWQSNVSGGGGGRTTQMSSLSKKSLDGLSDWVKELGVPESSLRNLPAIRAAAKEMAEARVAKRNAAIARHPSPYSKASPSPQLKAHGAPPSRSARPASTIEAWSLPAVGATQNQVTCANDHERPTSTNSCGPEVAATAHGSNSLISSLGSYRPPIGSKSPPDDSESLFISDEENQSDESDVDMEMTAEALRNGIRPDSAPISREDIIDQSGQQLDTSEVRALLKKPTPPTDRPGRQKGRSYDRTRIAQYERDAEELSRNDETQEPILSPARTPLAARKKRPRSSDPRLSSMASATQGLGFSGVEPTTKLGPRPPPPQAGVSFRPRRRPSSQAFDDESKIDDGNSTALALVDEVEQAKNDERPEADGEPDADPEGSERHEEISEAEEDELVERIHDIGDRIKELEDKLSSPAYQMQLDAVSVGEDENHTAVRLGNVHASSLSMSYRDLKLNLEELEVELGQSTITPAEFTTEFDDGTTEPAATPRIICVKETCRGAGHDPTCHANPSPVHPSDLYPAVQDAFDAINGGAKGTFVKMDDLEAELASNESLRRSIVGTEATPPVQLAVSRAKKMDRAGSGIISMRDFAETIDGRQAAFVTKTLQQFVVEKAMEERQRREDEERIEREKEEQRRQEEFRKEELKRQREKAAQLEKERKAREALEQEKLKLEQEKLELARVAQEKIEKEIAMRMEAEARKAKEEEERVQRDRLSEQEEETKKRIDSILAQEKKEREELEERMTAQMKLQREEQSRRDEEMKREMEKQKLMWEKEQEAKASEVERLKVEMERKLALEREERERQEERVKQEREAMQQKLAAEKMAREDLEKKIEEAKRQTVDSAAVNDVAPDDTEATPMPSSAGLNCCVDGHQWILHESGNFYTCEAGDHKLSISKWAVTNVRRIIQDMKVSSSSSKERSDTENTSSSKMESLLKHVTRVITYSSQVHKRTDTKVSEVAAIQSIETKTEMLTELVAEKKFLYTVANSEDSNATRMARDLLVLVSGNIDNNPQLNPDEESVDDADSESNRAMGFVNLSYVKELRLILKTQQDRDTRVGESDLTEGTDGSIERVLMMLHTLSAGAYSRQLILEADIVPLLLSFLNQCLGEAGNAGGTLATILAILSNLALSTDQLSQESSCSEGGVVMVNLVHAYLEELLGALDLLQQISNSDLLSKAPLEVMKDLERLQSICNQWRLQKERDSHGAVDSADTTDGATNLDNILRMDTRLRFSPDARPHEVAVCDNDMESVDADKYDVMVSYSWANSSLVRQTVKAMEEAGLRVWVDYKLMRKSSSGGVNQAMASAIELSTVVCVFTSQQYQLSANCKLEAEYAHLMKKPMMWITAQKLSAYTPNGWLGLLRGSALWYDFTDSEATEKNMPSLIDGILAACGKEVRPLNTRPVDTPRGDDSYAPDVDVDNSVGGADDMESFDGARIESFDSVRRRDSMDSVNTPPTLDSRPTVDSPQVHPIRHSLQPTPLTKESRASAFIPSVATDSPSYFRKERETAASTIQAATRGFLALRKFRSLQRRVLVIQSALRSFLVVKSMRRMWRSALVIQTYWRAFQATKHFRKEQRNALVIQAYVRSFLSASRYRRMKAAAVTIQSIFRGFSERAALDLDSLGAEEYDEDTGVTIEDDDEPSETCETTEEDSESLHDRLDNLDRLMEKIEADTGIKVDSDDETKPTVIADQPVLKDAAMAKILPLRSSENEPEGLLLLNSEPSQVFANHVKDTVEEANQIAQAVSEAERIVAMAEGRQMPSVSSVVVAAPSESCVPNVTSIMSEEMYRSMEFADSILEQVGTDVLVPMFATSDSQGSTQQVADMRNRAIVEAQKKLKERKRKEDEARLQREKIEAEKRRAVKAEESLIHNPQTLENPTEGNARSQAIRIAQMNLMERRRQLGY